jgi:hypothetical protein
MIKVSFKNYGNVNYFSSISAITFNGDENILNNSVLDQKLISLLFFLFVILRNVITKC